MGMLSTTEILVALDEAVRALAPLAGEGKANVEIAFVGIEGQEVPAWGALIEMGARPQAVRYEHPGQEPYVIESASVRLGGIEIRAQFSRPAYPEDRPAKEAYRHPAAMAFETVELAEES